LRLSVSPCLRGELLRVGDCPYFWKLVTVTIFAKGAGPTVAQASPWMRSVLRTLIAAARDSRQESSVLARHSRVTKPWACAALASPVQSFRPSWRLRKTREPSWKYGLLMSHS